MVDLATRETTAAWHLRGAWASRAVVVLSLDPAVSVMPRLAGYVERVSATGATAQIDPIDAPAAESWEVDGLITVPCGAVLNVRRPHFHEPGDARALAAPFRGPRLPDVPPDQMSFDLEQQLVLVPYPA